MKGNTVTDKDLKDKTVNVKALKETIREAFKTIISVREDRQQLNAQLAEVREKMVQNGVPKKVFALAQSYALLDSDNRELFNTFFDTFREVIDAEFQPNLFSND